MSFLNIDIPYWEAETYAPYTPAAWVFNTSSGSQIYGIKSDNYSAWAVHDGDVAAVPLPAAVWLMGSGLIGLAGVARRKKK